MGSSLLMGCNDTKQKVNKQRPGFGLTWFLGVWGCVSHSEKARDPVKKPKTVGEYEDPHWS